MILDIPNHIEQNIIQMAKNQPTLLTDFVENLPNRTHLGDGLAIQKALRNEWFQNKFISETQN